MNNDQIDCLSNRVIGCAIKVHKYLGPGFIEKIYAKALAHELQRAGIRFSQERSIKVRYEDILLGEHRLDFLIEENIILELKAVYDINNFHLAQSLPYLKAADKKLALIFNFSKAKLQIKRLVWNF